MGDELSKAVYGIGHKINYKPSEIKLVYTGQWKEYIETINEKVEKRIKYDPDIAIVQIPALSNQGYIDLATSPIEDITDLMNTPYFQLGCPRIMGSSLYVSTGFITGLVTSYLRLNTGIDIVSNAEGRSGNSGGPLVNKEGDLIGIHHSRYDKDGQGVATPVMEGSNVYELASLDQYFQ